jgi:hypothetical protein
LIPPDIFSRKVSIVESEVTATQRKHIENSVPDILAPLQAFTPRLQRLILKTALSKVTPEMAEAQEAEDCEDTTTLRLRIEKAKDDAIPLVKWLLERDPATKLAAIVVDAIVGSDIEHALSRNGYAGDIGHDLRADWEAEVVRMIDAPDTPPADRAVAAWIMGAITVT